MIVDPIRGLSLGGAETLWYSLRRWVVTHGPDGFDDTVVTDTLRANDHNTQRIHRRDLRIVEIPHCGVPRTLNRLDAVTFHSPFTSYLEKL